MFYPACSMQQKKSLFKKEIQIVDKVHFENLNSQCALSFFYSGKFYSVYILFLLMKMSILCWFPAP